jgi:fructokinase
MIPTYSEKMQTQPVICFGEMLWDLLPTGKVAGGAPMNVAVHLHQLGLDVHIVSKVGRDALGREILDFLQQKGVPAGSVQVDPIHPTGTVRVELNENGHPSYEITENVAWDYIHPDPQVDSCLEVGGVLVFGSLASRHPVSFQTLRHLLPLASLRACDINLRKPHYHPERIDFLLEQTDIAKLNDEELAEVVGWFRSPEDERSNMRFLLDKYDMEALIITKGEHGACYLDKNGYHFQRGYPVRVKDTVGSGDSFLAAFLSKYLKGEAIGECLAFAGAVGAYVATREGGTPRIDLEAVQAILHEEPGKLKK